MTTRILGMTKQELLNEARPFVCDGIPASGRYQRTNSMVHLLDFLTSSEGEAALLSDVRSKIEKLFAEEEVWR